MKRHRSRRAIQAAGYAIAASAWAWHGIAMAAADVAAAPSAAAVCQGCHGAHGEGNPPADIPRLAGQSSEYLEKQLRDYASGARENPVMQNFAKPLSDDDRTRIVAYFTAAQASFPAQNAKPTVAQMARGHQLAHQGAEAERVQACNNCHGPDGSGVLHSAPYLAGQSASYLQSTLQAWQQGTRKNDAGKLMSSVAMRLSAADVAAVAAYFGSLGTP